MSNCNPLEVVGRGSKTQIQLGNFIYLFGGLRFKLKGLNLGPMILCLNFYQIVFALDDD